MSRELVNEMRKLAENGFENPAGVMWYATCLRCLTEFRQLRAVPSVKCPFCDQPATRAPGIEFASCDRRTCNHDHGGKTS